LLQEICERHLTVISFSSGTINDRIRKTYDGPLSLAEDYNETRFGGFFAACCERMVSTRRTEFLRAQ